jgi:hypothetical protein
MNNKRKIIDSIDREFGERFRVFDNTRDNKKVVAGQFPDVILMRLEPPPNNDILFVMRIEGVETNLVDSISEWQALGSTSSVLYIIVPRNRLDDAKKLASVTGVRARFGSYEVADGGDVRRIHYE